METILPLILIGLGSAALLVMRVGQLVLGGLFLQWLGLVLVVLLVGGVGSGILIAEGVTALACIAILALTLTSVSYPRRARRMRVGGFGGGEGSRTPNAAEDLWPVVVAVASAIAGLVLARLYPLGAPEGLMVAFYWTMLAGLLVLVLEGARGPVKLAAGLLALMNGTALLLNTLPGFASEPVVLGLMSVARISLAALLAYSWTLIHSLFSELSFTPLFSARDPIPSTEEAADTAVEAAVEPPEGARLDDHESREEEGAGEEVQSPDGPATGAPEPDEERLTRTTPSK